MRPTRSTACTPACCVTSLSTGRTRCGARTSPTKAEAILADFDLGSYLTALLESEQYDGELLVREILSARRDVDTAELAQVESLVSLLAEMEPRSLVPTASPQGDRYYVRASWPTDDTDGEIKACLIDVFNQELITTRSLDEEAALMTRLQGTRFLYWYSKEWAEHIARSITGCGAVASFTPGTTVSTPGTTISN